MFLALGSVSKQMEEHNEVCKSITKYNELVSRITSAKLICDEIQRNITSSKASVDPHKALIADVEKNLADLAHDLVGHHAHKITLAKDLMNTEQAVAVFSPAGVRAHILDTVTPFLNAKTSEYLTALSDGNIKAVWTTLTKTAKGELREKFGIDVSNDKGAESFRGLSGGEKRKVRLSCMLALQDLVASRASKPINLLMCDEIDDALDAAGLERLLTILEAKGRERGTVIIISHRELSDWVDDVTVVTKKGGVSTVTGALCI
jgi:DNA repair exonuclease SbcCD ATPase subunit